MHEGRSEPRLLLAGGGVTSWPAGASPPSPFSQPVEDWEGCIREGGGLGRRPNAGLSFSRRRAGGARPLSSRRLPPPFSCCLAGLANTKSVHIEAAPTKDSDAAFKVSRKTKKGAFKGSVSKRDVRTGLKRVEAEVKGYRPDLVVRSLPHLLGISVAGRNCVCLCTLRSKGGGRPRG